MTVSQDNIDRYVEELCALDESFELHKDQLALIVGRMLEEAPTWEPDETFVSSLKARLESTSLHTTSHSFLSFFSMQKAPALFVGAGVLAVVLLVGVVTLPQLRSTHLATRTQVKDSQTRFVSLEGNAFGPLNQLAVSTPTRESMSVGSGGAGLGGGNAMSAAAAPMRATSDVAVSEDAVIDSKMIAPYPITRTRYEYVGDPITLPTQSEFPVYQYQVNQVDPDIGSLPFHMLDLSSFSSLAAQNIQLVEEKDRGYALNLNLSTGISNIYVNYASWPELNCIDSCEYRELTDSDLPQDQSLIDKANAFLKEKGIDTSLYGEPHVDNTWRTYRGPGETYVPSVLSVIYPIVLPEGSVYDNSGNPFGLSVSINIQYNFVDGVNNIYSGQFAGSEYALEQDTDRILKFAADGGQPYIPWYIEDETTVKEVTFQLETPDVVYIQYWAPYSVMRIRSPYSYDQVPMYIPALRFPVSGDADEAVYKPQYVIVPIVSDILDTYQSESVVPPLPTEPIPMPLEDTPAVSPRDAVGGVAEPEGIPML